MAVGRLGGLLLGREVELSGQLPEASPMQDAYDETEKGLLLISCTYSHSQRVTNIGQSQTQCYKEQSYSVTLRIVTECCTMNSLTELD